MLNEKIIKICKQKLIYLNYAKRTQDMYIHYIKKFLISLKDKQIIHVTSKEFQDYLDRYNFTSVSQQNQIINAIRFLYKYGLNKKYDKVSFKRPKKEKHLPQIIDKDYLLNSINNIQNVKHRAILSIAYSVGLRVSEVCNLRLTDIDSGRMVIIIRQSKGRKDRIVPLTHQILHILRQYYKTYKPKEYLFNGQNSLKYTPWSCNKIVKKYLGEKYHFHLLRHAAFTHLTDEGIDIRAIQKLAGHSSSRTTEIYTQVSTQVLHKLPLAI